MSQIAVELAAKIVAPLATFEIPGALAASIIQHERNLIDLATALLNNGCDRQTVEMSLEKMFESYRKQLADVIVRLNEDADAV